MAEAVGPWLLRAGERAKRWRVQLRGPRTSEIAPGWVLQTVLQPAAAKGPLVLAEGWIAERDFRVGFSPSRTRQGLPMQRTTGRGTDPDRHDPRHVAPAVRRLRSKFEDTSVPSKQFFQSAGGACWQAARAEAMAQWPARWELAVDKSGRGPVLWVLAACQSGWATSTDRRIFRQRSLAF